MIDTDRLLQVLVEMADSLVADFDPVEFLHQMAEHTAAISGRPSVGVVLGDAPSRLEVVASSSATARELETVQLASGEGPCVDCCTTNRPVAVPDLLTAAERWPSFAAAAADRGIRSAHSFAMRLRESTIGVITVFGEEPMPLEGADARAIQAVADVASIALLQERGMRAAGVLTVQLEGALHSRIVIEQAKGVVAVTLGIDVDTAFTLLRRRARLRGTQLLALAEAVVSGTLEPRLLLES